MEGKKILIKEVNADARAVIMGCACVITSRLSPEQIDKFYVYHPEALQIVDEDGEVVFSLDIDDSNGRLSNKRAVFSRVTSPEGKATITILIDMDCENKLEAVQGAVGQGLFLLDELEEHLISRLPDLDKDAEEAWDLFSEL